MEELTEEVVAESPEAETAPVRKFAWVLPAWLALSRRQLLIGAMLLAVIAGAAVGGVAYRAHAEQKQAVAALARQAEHDAAARAEALAAARERRRLHEEILAASPFAPPQLPVEVLGLNGVGEKAMGSQGAAELLVRGDVGVPMNVAAAPTAAPLAQMPAASARATSPPAKTAPDIQIPPASGGCALSGQAPADYGKALGRCLEEFNRLEGRKG